MHRAGLPGPGSGQLVLVPGTARDAVACGSPDWLFSPLQHSVLTFAHAGLSRALSSGHSAPGSCTVTEKASISWAFPARVPGPLLVPPGISFPALGGS